MHVPAAHPDGDALVHFPAANVLHTGDVFVRNSLPFIDLGSGGSVRGLLAAVARALALVDDETDVIPGHGPLSHKADLVAYQAMVTTIVTRVEEAMAGGQDLPAVLASKPVRGFEERVAGGFVPPDAFVTAVFFETTSMRSSSAVARRGRAISLRRVGTSRESISPWTSLRHRPRAISTATSRMVPSSPRRTST
jgi:hypothetical protein